ncbi:MAG: hypothetical protein HYV07_27465 [Deltaproteobacteria bacterium]|nr:hypothetical protein [Deltaproteobacteria bacterium]
MMGSLKSTCGRIPERFVLALRRDPELVRRVVQRILDEHFEPSLHEGVLSAVGLDLDVLAPGTGAGAARGEEIATE